MTPELVGKQLEMLKEIAPKASWVAVLWNPANPGNPPQLRAAELAARTLGIRLQPLEARSPREIDSAFAAMSKDGGRGGGRPLGRNVPRLARKIHERSELHSAECHNGA
jgi:hypothetical protein